MSLVKKSFFKNILFNIVGSLIFSVVSQIVIYPFLAYKFDNNLMGRILVIMAISNSLAVIFGASLNNVKLLNNSIYIDGFENCDFKPILRCFSIVIIAIYIVLLNTTDIFKFNFEFITVIIMTILTMYRCYLDVYYRLKLEYKKIVYQTFILSLGYLFGVALNLIFNMWTMIFLVGEIASVIFMITNSEYKNEKFETTINLRSTLKNTFNLMASSILGNLITYLDRFIINPTLGVANVTVFFVASFIGKTISVFIQPIGNVLLSYSINIEREKVKKVYFKIIGLLIMLSAVMMLVSMVVSPVIINIIYRKNMSASKPYFNVANLSAIISAVTNLLNPIILRYCKSYWQIIIQGIYLLIYIILAILLMKINGLYGFCIAAIIAALIKFVITAGIGAYFIAIKE